MIRHPDEHRQHPITVFRYTYRYLFLLAVPLLHSILYVRSAQGLYAWASGAWIDLTVIALLLLLPFLAWRCHTYRLTEDGFYIRQGILLPRCTFIPRRGIITLAVERPVYLRPFRAVHIAIDTDAGTHRRADFTLTVREKQADAILAQRRHDNAVPLHRYHPCWYHVVMLSLLASDSFSGVLLLAATFRQTGRLLGEGFQQRLLGNLETVAEFVALIPRTAAVIALVLIAGWCFAAGRNILRLLPFSISRYPHTLTIRAGLIVRREYSCIAASVSYVDYRQSLISRLLRLHMVFISCIGYGKSGRTTAILVPVAPARHSERDAHRLLPEFRSSTPSVRPIRLSSYRYAMYPLWTMILLYPASVILPQWFPEWQELIFYLIRMAYIPCLWLLTVKLIDRFTAGAAYRDGVYTLRYSRYFTFHTVAVPAGRIVAVTFSQTVFQRHAGSCDVLVYTCREARRYHRIRNLPSEQAHALFDRRL